MNPNDPVTQAQYQMLFDANPQLVNPSSPQAPPNENIEAPPSEGSEFYDAPQSSYIAAQYDFIGGSGMNGYFQTGPHPAFMPAGAHNRPATYAAGAARAAELAGILEGHQAAAGFTGKYPESDSDKIFRESETRRIIGEQDWKDCTEMFILKRVMGIGG